MPRRCRAAVDSGVAPRRPIAFCNLTMPCSNSSALTADSAAAYFEFETFHGQPGPLGHVQYLFAGGGPGLRGGEDRRRDDLAHGGRPTCRPRQCRCRSS